MSEVLAPLQVVDTTGAGDSFLAGLVSQMSFNKSKSKNYSRYKEIVRFGAACGALTCAGAGAIEPQPTLREVETFLGAL